jgi:hypothetical protein
MTGRWFFPGPPVSSANKDRHDITEILLKMALNKIKPNQLIRLQYGCLPPTRNSPKLFDAH